MKEKKKAQTMPMLYCIIIIECYIRGDFLESHIFLQKPLKT